MIFQFISNINVFFLFILLLQDNLKIIFSFNLFLICVKEEIIFRIIPFYFIDKNLKNCFILGVFHGFHHFIFFNFDFIKFIIYFILGFVYSLKYINQNNIFDTYINIIQFRYILLNIILNN